MDIIVYEKKGSALILLSINDGKTKRFSGKGSCRIRCENLGEDV